MHHTCPPGPRPVNLGPGAAHPSSTLLLILFMLAFLLVGTSAYKRMYIEGANVCSPSQRRQKLKMSEGDDIYGIIVQLTHYASIADKTYGLDCKFEVIAPDGFRLFLVIEKMDFRISTEGRCIDSIKFKWSGYQSGMLCGTRKPSDPLVDPSFVSDANSDAINMFHDRGEIKVDVNIGPKYLVSGPNQNLNPPVPIEITLIFTAFKGCSQLGVFKQWKSCPGYNDFCINDNLICDNHINCGLGSKNDESGCEPEPAGGQLPIFVFVIILVGLLIMGILFCGAVHHLRKGRHCCWKPAEVSSVAAHRQYHHRPPSRVPNRRHSVHEEDPPEVIRPSAPEETHLEDFSVLPPETSAPRESDSTHLEAKNDVNEDLPPSYASLFPEDATSSRA